MFIIYFLDLASVWNIYEQPCIQFSSFRYNNSTFYKFLTVK